MVYHDVTCRTWDEGFLHNASPRSRGFILDRFILDRFILMGSTFVSSFFQASHGGLSLPSISMLRMSNQPSLECTKTELKMNDHSL